MRKLLLILLTAATVFSLQSCNKVPVGNVGIKVYLLGGSKGVDSEVLKTGRHWIGFNEELYLFPTFTQNYVWTKGIHEGSKNDESISFDTMSGLKVGADVGITYHLEESKVGQVFQKYRRGIEEVTDTFLRNIVRDAFVSVTSKKKVQTVYGSGKSDMLLEVMKIVKDQTDPIGIIVDKIYLVGSLRLPPNVTAGVNRKIEATQKAEQRENELREAEAEAQKKIAESRGEAESVLLSAKAQAEANRILTKSLTPELIKYEALQKWDGKLPTVMDGKSLSMLSLDAK